MDLSEIVSIEMDAILIRCQYSGAAWHRSPTDCRMVVENRTNTDDPVRPINNLACAGRADLTPIYAGELQMVLRKEALSRGHHRDGAAQRFCQLDCLLFSTGRPQLASDHQYRLLLSLEEFRCPRDCSLEWVAGLFTDDRADRPWRRTRSRRNVAGDFDVSGLFFSKGGTDRVIDLVWHVFGGGDGDGRAGELFCDFQLVRPIMRRQRVVNQMLGRTIVRVGCTGHNRSVLGRKSNGPHKVAGECRDVHNGDPPRYIRESLAPAPKLQHKREGSRRVRFGNPITNGLQLGLSRVADNYNHRRSGARVYRLAILGLQSVKHLAQRLDAACVNIGDAPSNGRIQGIEPSLALLQQPDPYGQNIDPGLSSALMVI